MLVVVPHDRRLSSRIPSPTARWDEHEAALIEEGNVGATSSRFFLLRATCAASSARWRPRRAELLGALAPDNSNHTIEGRATDGSGDSGHQTPCGSAWRSVSRSIARWETRGPSLRREGAWGAFRAAWRSTSRVCPASAWPRAPHRRPSSSLESSDAPLQGMPGPAGRSPESLSLPLTTPRHDDVASPSSLPIR